jgi:hypothetical protein
MSGRQYPLRINQGPSAATGLVHGNENLPRELTPGRPEAADDLAVRDDSGFTCQRWNNQNSYYFLQLD